MGNGVRGVGAGMRKTSRKTEERKYRLPGRVHQYYPLFMVAIIVLTWLTLRGRK